MDERETDMFLYSRRILRLARDGDRRRCFVFSLALHRAEAIRRVVIAGDQARPADVGAYARGLGLDRRFVQFVTGLAYSARRSRHLDLHEPAGCRAD